MLVRGALPAAVVTDAHVRSVVAGVRGLGRAGVEVVALGPGRLSAGARSRYVSRRAVVPSVRDDAPGFVAGVLEHARAASPVVVLPGIEDSVEALLPVLGDVEGQVTFGLPGAEVLGRLRDKAALERSARDLGFGEVVTLAAGQAGRLDAATIPVPCIVKSSAPVGRMAGPAVVTTREGLHEVLAGLWPEQPVVVQELLEGPLEAVSVVLDREGRLVERFQQRALRTWPHAAGSSSLAVSVAPEPALVEQVAEMLRRQGFWGLAQVQLLRSPAGRVPIDVNPRFYGSLALAEACGALLTERWLRVAAGLPAGTPGTYRTGVQYRWLQADLSAAFQGRWHRLRAGRAAGRVGAMWAMDDPVPSALLTAELVASRLGGLRRRAADAA